MDLWDSAESQVSRLLVSSVQKHPAILAIFVLIKILVNNSSKEARFPRFYGRSLSQSWGTYAVMSAGVRLAIPCAGMMRIPGTAVATGASITLRSLSEVFLTSTWMSPHVLTALQCWIRRCWTLTLNFLILGVATFCWNDEAENLILGGLKSRK